MYMYKLTLISKRAVKYNIDLHIGSKKKKEIKLIDIFIFKKKLDELGLVSL